MRTHAHFGDRFRKLLQERLRAVAEFFAAGEYTMSLPIVLRVLTPWYGEPHRRLHARISERTTLPVERLYYLMRFAERAPRLGGAVAEVGSYRGGSGRILGEICAPCPVHLFDTFEGMPAGVERDRDGHVPGDFGDTSVESVARYLADLDNVHLHPGFVPETLSAVRDLRFSFVHCDLDTYQGTKDALEFFYPRLLPGGVLLFDEYALRAYEHAERAAVDEFFSERPETPVVLGSGQGFVVKLPE